MNPYIELGNYVFENCVNLPNFMISDTWTRIPEGTFSMCNSFTEIKIPDTIIEVDEFAFEDCRGLVSIELSNSLTSIEDYTFELCTSLLNIRLPESITIIKDSAFENCRSLELIEIGSQMETIEDYAFYGCKSLSQIICKAIAPPIIYSNTFNYFNAILYVPKDAITLYQKDAYWKKFVNIKALEEYSLPNNITMELIPQINVNQTISFNCNISADEDFEYNLNWNVGNSQIATIIDQNETTVTLKVNKVGETYLEVTIEGFDSYMVNTPIIVTNDISTGIESLDPNINIIVINNGIQLVGLKDRRVDIYHLNVI